MDSYPLLPLDLELSESWPHYASRYAFTGIYTCTCKEHQIHFSNVFSIILRIVTNDAI